MLIQYFVVMVQKRKKCKHSHGWFERVILKNYSNEAKINTILRKVKSSEEIDKVICMKYVSDDKTIKM